MYKKLMLAGNVLMVVSAVALAFMALAYSTPVHAENECTSIFGPTRVELGDVFEAHVLNFSKQPLRVKVELRDAKTFELLDELAHVGELDPRSGTSLAITIDAENFPEDGTVFVELEWLSRTNVKSVDLVQNMSQTVREVVVRGLFGPVTCAN